MNGGNIMDVTQADYPCTDFTAWTDDDPCDNCGFQRSHHAGQDRPRALRSRVVRPEGLSRPRSRPVENLCRHENHIFEIVERFRVHPDYSYVRCSDCRQRFTLKLGEELCSHMISSFDSHWRLVYDHPPVSLALPHCGSCNEVVIHVRDLHVSSPLAEEYEESCREQSHEEQDQRNLRNLTEAMTASRHINEDPETCAHQDHVEIPTPGPRTNAMCSYCGAILVKWTDAQTAEEIVEPENEERAVRIVQIYQQAIEGGGTRAELYRRFQRVYGPPTSPVEVWNA